MGLTRTTGSAQEAVAEAVRGMSRWGPQFDGQERRLHLARGVEKAREDIVALLGSALDFGAEEAQRGASLAE